MFKFLFCKWVVGWVRAGPDAAGTSIQVAAHAMTAAMCQDAGWLVGQVLGWIDHLRLQGYFRVYMLAILDFQGLPGFFGHNSTSLASLEI